jgi:aminoglycoside 6'-N-acetyltransferase I
MNIHVIDLRPDAEPPIRQVAEMLVEAFKEDWPDAWPDLNAAMEEVHESFAPGRISRVAIDGQGTVLGWIGGIPRYGGRVWELHPLAVRPTQQRRGIGRALVADLEERVKERGGITLWVGTDDESGQTSLSGIDLYPDVCAHIAKLCNLRNHPYGFYQKLGFVVVGVVPDANGWGRPDILMAKRVGKEVGGPDAQGE